MIRVSLRAALVCALLIGGAAVMPGRAQAAVVLQVLAGSGTAGSSGDGGPATAAALHSPSGVAVAPDGRVYISDAGNHVVRAVGPDGTISTVAGNGTAGTRDTVVAADARAVDVALGSPDTLALGADGVLYVADVAESRVFAVTASGGIRVVARNDGVLQGVTTTADDTVYIGAPTAHRVVTAADGSLTPVAGNGQAQVTAAGGPATEVAVPAANSLAADGAGAVWIASGQLLHRLAGGRIATVTLNGDRWVADEGGDWPPAQPPLNGVASVAAHGSDVYVLRQDTGEVQRLGADGSVTAVVRTRGTVAEPVTGQIAVDDRGRVLIADPAGNRVYAAVPATDEGDDTGGDPLWWPWIAGAVVILAGLGIWLGRRRR